MNHLDYTYDALGNRTQQTENTVTTSYTYNNMMRLTSKTVAGQATDFTYDLNGNMTEKEEGNSSYTYTWDINNRLREVREDGGLLFEYLYDSQGRRVKSHNHSTGVTTTYIYAGINVIHEVTSTESIDFLYANGMRIAKKTGATVKYFHSDHLGSTRLVTDSSGQPTFESDYKPFGEDANATGTEKYAFTGQYSEADIGLYYFGARWYDASLGRFISEDPIKGSMTSSQSQNPYVYCMNNPLRYIDPSGMLMTEGGAYHEGYLQSYSGGEWVYYPESGGTCNVSGDSYTEDYFAKQSTTSTPDNAITGNDVKKTVTKSNFFANYNFMGKGSPINKPGTRSMNYWDYDNPDNLNIPATINGLNQYQLNYNIIFMEITLINIIHDPKTNQVFIGCDFSPSISSPGFSVSLSTIKQDNIIDYLNSGTIEVNAGAGAGGHVFINEQGTLGGHGIDFAIGKFAGVVFHTKEDYQPGWIIDL